MSIVIHLAGTSFRQDDLKHCKAGESVILEPEPDNPHDKNAIAIRRFVGNRALIGYIPRLLAERWGGKVPVHTSARIKEILGGTPEKPTLGALIELET
jgi:hypothetical protein